MHSLEGTNSNLLVPVLRPLGSDQELRVPSDDRRSLGSDASLVLVARNLEVLSILLEALGNVVNCLHGVNVGLLNDHL